MTQKRLVFDLDDTISHTTNRDYENAKPDLNIIGHINSLYDDGWEIYIVTARGQLSCNGDTVEAEKRNRPQIEKWLLDHGVKYHKLSFEKFYARYYIDDKAMSINEFKAWAAE